MRGSLVGRASAVVLCSACSAEVVDPPHEEARDAGALEAPAPTEPPSFEPTFSAIYTEIFSPAACHLGLCHGDGALGGGLPLFPRETGYAALVNQPSESDKCGPLGLLRVAPGLPDDSLLYLKLEGMPPCGVRMPPHEPLDERHVAQVREWIERGAPND